MTHVIRVFIVGKQNPIDVEFKDWRKALAQMDVICQQGVRIKDEVQYPVHKIDRVEWVGEAESTDERGTSGSSYLD